METTGNPVLENLLYDAASGTLEFNGIRYMLIRPETIVEIQKAIEEKFGAEVAWEIFYQSGYRGTSLTAEKLLKQGLSPQRCLEVMFQMGSHLGWGNFKTTQTGPKIDKAIEVTIQGSPFAKAYGLSDRAVCALLSGALAGIFSTLTNKKYICREIKCLAVGHSHCHFRMEQLT